MPINSKRMYILAAALSGTALFLASPAASESLAPDIVTVDFSCSYNAYPQGFRYDVRRYTFSDGRQEQHIRLQSIQPAYFAPSVHPDIKNSTTDYSLIGEQDIGSLYGGLAGAGYYRDIVGAPIDGNVWIIEDYAGPYPFPQTSNIYTKVLTGSGISTDCVDETSVRHQMNINSPQRPAGFPQMPIVSGASRAFNDRAQLSGSGATGNGSEFAETDFDWINDDSFHAARILGLMKSITGEGGEGLTLEHRVLAGSKTVEMKLPLHDWKTAMKIAGRLKVLGIESVAKLDQANPNADGNGNTVDPKPVAVAVLSTVNTAGAINIREGTSSAFVGFLTVDPILGNPSIPPSLGSSDTAKLIYPAYLFDPPKYPSYYEGRAVNAREKYGPVAIQYTHAPLPSQCNPNNPNYTHPAFFNSEVLEELAIDWKYLNAPNWSKLKDKGFDLYDPLFTEFLISCEEDLESADINDTTDCINDFVVAESNDPSAIIYPPLPYQILQEPVVIQSQPKGIGRHQAAQEKDNRDKYQRKTDAYYTDLIENKLLTLNPEWTSAHRQSCVPQQASADKVTKPVTVKGER